METNAINDAGVAYRAIQRLLLSITDDEIKKADLARPELNPLIEAMDTLQAIKDIEKKKIKNIRTHSSGDFFSKDYFLMWVNIANRFQELNIFTYSKAPQIKNFTLPNNFNIINSFIDYNGKKLLNYGTYESLKPIAKSIKGLICPITKGQATNNQKLKDLTCSICKYCITKSKPLFVQH